MRAALLGNEVLLLVRGTIASKSFSLPKDGDEVEYVFSVRDRAAKVIKRAGGTT